MKQTDSLKRIEMPNPNINNEYVCYGDRMKSLNFEPGELKAAYQRHESKLLSMAEKAAWDYLLDA